MKRPACLIMTDYARFLPRHAFSCVRASFRASAKTAWSAIAYSATPATTQNEKDLIRRNAHRKAPFEDMWQAALYARLLLRSALSR